jgi:hypothetical protein
MSDIAPIIIETHIVDILPPHQNYDTIRVTNTFLMGHPIDIEDHFVIGPARITVLQIRVVPIKVRLTFIDGYVAGIEFI